MKDNSSKLIIALIIIAGFAIGYLYYSQFSIPEDLSVLKSPIPINDDLFKFKDIGVNFSIISDAKYKSLITIGESPVSAGSKGKKDLFAPI